jgi:hypothetical protein
MFIRNFKDNIEKNKKNIKSVRDGTEEYNGVT